MSFSHFAAMQRAVDIVQSSAHETNKIAACLTGSGPDGLPFTVAMTNYWPAPIRARFAADARIGESSGTIHAETACLLTAPRSVGATLCVTDPFCPNCAKNIAEAGVRAVYIDHKGFGKDFARRREEDFRAMSLPVCRRAGVAVYVIDRKGEGITPLHEPAPGFTPAEDRPVSVRPVEPGLESQTFRLAVNRPHNPRRFACGLARDDRNQPFILTGFSHPAIGFSYAEDRALLEGPVGKYTFLLEPLNRLLMNAAKTGLKLQDGMIYSSQVPTSRELVNLIGAGHTKLQIGDRGKGRDDASMAAVDCLESRGVLDTSPGADTF